MSDSRSIPIPLAMGRFRRLAQRSTEVWQGSLRKLPAWIDNPADPDGPPHRPAGAVWASVRTGLFHLELPEEGEAVTPQLALRAFLQFGVKWAKELDGRPAHVEVDDPHLRDALEPALAELKTPVILVRDLPLIKDTLFDLEAAAQEGFRAPGALEAHGVTPERFAAFAAAAADFYRARPWRHLSNEDLIVVEAPHPPRGMKHLCVLGLAGMQFGLSFFDSRREFEEAAGLRSPSRAAQRPARAFGVTFGPIDEMPFADLDAWDDHSFPLAGPHAYPFPAELRMDGTMTRPEASALTFMEALLRMIAVTTEDELDAGRWQRTMDTYDGPVTLTLTLPLLLEAEQGKAFSTPPRAVPRTLAERGSVQISRFLEQRSFASLDEMNAALETARQEGLFETGPEAVAGRPLTPLEHAQELAYDAMEATGRRQIKLARQALAISRDCADAWVVLGEAAADAESALALYQHGLDAGARAIGSAAFAELKGEFWQHLPTRPYMRARLLLAETLRDLGQHDAALAHYQEMLELNPNDNQGVRYLLLVALLEDKRDEDAGKLLARYLDDIQAIWRYAHTLWLLRTHGDTPRTERALDEAIRVNPHVVKYLLKPESLPEERPPHFALGSKDEAAYAADELLDAFESTAGALPWLRLRAAAVSGRSRTGSRVQKLPRGSSGRPRNH
jgi:tetratricopeptide (TPR) repeat protein